jgi:hypothetical protein
MSRLTRNQLFLRDCDKTHLYGNLDFQRFFPGEDPWNPRFKVWKGRGEGREREEGVRKTSLP